MEQSNQESKSNSLNDEARQTMFSVSGRNQLELIAIADNKANMIAAICTALIFFIIALFSFGFTREGSAIFEDVEFVLPLGILMVFCCVSVICAILALKPKIVRTKKEGRSLLFFHNYYRMSLEEYKEGMQDILKSPEDIYDHLLTTMYFNGQVLERKYALLGFAYSIFLMAIVGSVLAYIITSVF